MDYISATKAREKIYQLLTDVNNSNQPVTITNNKGNNCVLISESDWNAIQETLYLNSVTDLADDIINGMNTKVEDCLDENEVKW